MGLEGLFLWKKKKPNPNQTSFLLKWLWILQCIKKGWGGGRQILEDVGLNRNSRQKGKSSSALCPPPPPPPQAGNQAEGDQAALLVSFTGLSPVSCWAFSIPFSFQKSSRCRGEKDREMGGWGGGCVRVQLSPRGLCMQLKTVKQHCKNVTLIENLQLLYTFLRASLSQWTCAAVHVREVPPICLPLLPNRIGPRLQSGGGRDSSGFTSHLNQGCIELEMDEVVDETHVGITCIFRLVHSHPPNPPTCRWHISSSRRCSFTVKGDLGSWRSVCFRETALPCGSDQVEKQFQGVESRGKPVLWREERE